MNIKTILFSEDSAIRTMCRYVKQIKTHKIK